MVKSRIDERIEQIVGMLADKPSYLYDNWQTANVELDKVDLPCVVNVLPVSGALNVDEKRLKDSPNCLIAFLDKADFDFDGKENEGVVERCKRMAKEWIILANRSGFFNPIDGDVPYSVIYDKMDSNLTGIAIELQLTEKDGLYLCPTKDANDIVNE